MKSIKIVVGLPLLPAHRQNYFGLARRRLRKPFTKEYWRAIDEERRKLKQTDAEYAAKERAMRRANSKRYNERKRLERLAAKGGVK
jgi:hypothetical protein